MGTSQTALILKAQRAAIKHDLEQKLQQIQLDKLQIDLAAQKSEVENIYSIMKTH